MMIHVRLLYACSPAGYFFLGIFLWGCAARRYRGTVCGRAAGVKVPGPPSEYAGRPQYAGGAMGTPSACLLSACSRKGPLGVNGLTAYFGLLSVGQPTAGETVMVSAAAGSVGHMVGQMAKIKENRVVGVCGSEEKCIARTHDLGFDAAVNYKDDGFRDSLKSATPDGADVYFDNTGGMILGAALFRRNVGGRIACCGVVSQYDTDRPEPGPKGIPGLLVNKRINMRGFLVFDFAQQYEQLVVGLTAGFFQFHSKQRP